MCRLPSTAQYKITPPPFVCPSRLQRLGASQRERNFYDGFTVKFKFRYAKFEPSEHPFATQTDVVKNQ